MVGKAGKQKKHKKEDVQDATASIDYLPRNDP
jgi:hypothetical protein